MANTIKWIAFFLFLFSQILKERLEELKSSIMDFVLLSAHKWIALFLSSGFFLGFLPGKISPKFKGKLGGLMGSIVGLVILIPLWTMETCNVWTFVIITIVLTVVSVPIIQVAESFMLRKWGAMKRSTGVTVSFDFNQTCLDETLGMFWMVIIIWFLREPVTPISWWPLVPGFVLFRFLDVTKPWPIHLIEDWGEKPGATKTDIAFSIVADDAIAGILAGIITAILVLAGQRVVAS